MVIPGLIESITFNIYVSDGTPPAFSYKNLHLPSIIGETLLVFMLDLDIFNYYW